MPDEPGDECPFPKPSPDQFRACPTYQPRLIFPTDASDRPLPAVLAGFGPATRLLPRPELEANLDPA
jgi:hypothetical protein